jgi:predicted PurR-regulated permease PerM
MNVPETRSGEGQRAEGARTTTSRHTGETRTVVLTVGAIAVFLYLIRPILLPFVVAGIIAYIGTPLLDWLAKRTRLPRSLFAVLLFLLLLGCAGLIVAVAGQRLAAEAASTITDLQGTLEHLLRQATGDQSIRLFGQSMDADQIVRTIFDRIHDWFGQPDQLASITGSALVAVMATFLTAVLLIWFLVSGPSVARGLFWMVPPSRRPLVAQIWLRLDPVLKRYFLGVAAIVIYAMAAAYIGLGLILGLDHAVLLALMTGLGEMLPIIGSTAVAIIAGLVALHTASGIMSIVAFAVYAIVLRLSIDQIVAPLVLGRAANLHPVLIIFCFLAGAVVFGITGVILAVPVALAVKTTLATLYGEDDRSG